MDYNEACKILGVTTTDTLEDIKKKHKKLARKYHPDVNSKDTTEIMQQINLAFEILSMNFNNKSYTLSYEEFVQKYKTNAKILYYMSCINMNFKTLYDIYTDYINTCISNNVEYNDLFTWIQDFECAKTYADIVSKDDVYFIYSTYIKSNSMATESFSDYTLKYLTFRINDCKFCNLTQTQFLYLIKEYIINGKDGTYIDFNEWLDQKLIGYSKDRVQRNINKIINFGNLNYVSDTEIYEILFYITNNPDISKDSRFIPLRNMNTYKLIFIFVARQNPKVLQYQQILNSDIDTLVDAYFNSEYQYASFNDFLNAISQFKLESEVEDIDNVNKIKESLRKEYKRKK